MSLVVLQAVEKRFGDKLVLAGIDLELASGSVLGFLGPNGAGKSTTLRVLLGLIRADAGVVRVLGRDPGEEPNVVRAEIGVLFDRDGHYDRLSARSNLEFHAGIRGMQPRTARVRIEELLRSYGLWDRRADRVATFSKGMRQKLAIVRAMLHRPRLLLLDEPFTGLDPRAAIDLRESLRNQVLAEGLGILLTTHDLHHVEKICDRVAVIDQGHVLAAGTPAELAAASSDTAQQVRVVGENISEALLESMQKDGLLISGYLEGGEAKISCSAEQFKQLGRELVLRGVVLQNLSAKSRSLEDAFLGLVSRGAP